MLAYEEILATNQLLAQEVETLQELCGTTRAQLRLFADWLEDYHGNREGVVGWMEEGRGEAGGAGGESKGTASYGFPCGAGRGSQGTDTVTHTLTHTHTLPPSLPPSLTGAPGGG